MYSEARKARTAEIDLSQLRVQHATALAGFRMLLTRWEAAEQIDTAKQRRAERIEAYTPPTPEQMHTWARRVVLSELKIITGTITKEAVADFD